MARSLLLGAVLGLATRLVYHGPTELLWLHKIGVPWLAAAFLVGALRPTWRSGAFHGAAALVLAVVVYYTAPVAEVGSGIGLAWIWIAVPGGIAFGALGALWCNNEGWRVPASAVMIGAFLGEAMLWYGRDRPVVALAEYTVAAVLLGLLLTSNEQRATAAIAAIGLAVFAAIAEIGVYLSLGYLVG